MINMNEHVWKKWKELSNWNKYIISLPFIFTHNEGVLVIFSNLSWKFAAMAGNLI